MSITIHNTFLPFTDADASVKFYRDVLGWDVRLDVGYGDMRWITVGPSDQPDTAVVLQPVIIPGQGLSDDEATALQQVVAKGAWFGINLATDDLDAEFERISNAGAEVVQEPIDQSYGVRDAAFRDPAGNLIRIQQKKD